MQVSISRIHQNKLKFESLKLNEKQQIMLLSNFLNANSSFCYTFVWNNWLKIATICDYVELENISRI